MDEEDRRARGEYLVTARAILFNTSRLRHERLARAAAKIELMGMRAKG
jgi:hypothetical protein